MVKATIYICSDKVSSDTNYIACSAILEMCLFKVDITEDRDKACKLGRGKVNPVNGFVIEVPSIVNNVNVPIILTSWLGLVNYLQDEGLIPMIY